MDKDKNPKVDILFPGIFNQLFPFYESFLSRLTESPFVLFHQWEPSKLELIDDSTVDRYFSKVNDDEWEDLKLPTRSNFNLPSYAIAKL